MWLQGLLYDDKRSKMRAKCPKSPSTQIKTTDTDAILRISRFLFHVPRTGLEPVHPEVLVFETNASTNSAIWAKVTYLNGVQS